MSSQKQSSANEAVISQRIAQQIGSSSAQVNAAVQMLDSGDTVPFISRYRKEATGGLTDTQLRLLEERLLYLRELESRRSGIINSIDEMGKLDDVLKKRIINAQTKSELEDLYLPFKKKRKTKGQTAIAAGLEPLADSLWNNPSQNPQAQAEQHIDAEAGYADTKAVLDGAKYILMERFAEDATLISRLRELLLDKGYLCASVIDEKAADAEKFQDYFDYQERYNQVPSHRALAVFRGRNAGVLSASIKVQQTDGEYGDEPCVSTVASHVGFVPNGAAADTWREQVVGWTWKVKLSTHLETDLMSRLRTAAEEEAIKVFASNLKALLLAAPAGERCTLGLDPGYRSGVKVVVVNVNGKLLDYTTIYPHAPQKQWQKSVAILSEYCDKYNVDLIAVGNGTASRETDQLADEIIKNTTQKGVTKVMVSEAGASVYSASATAEQEFPTLDVTIRGAVSIARRLQDPLAELVKIDPKAIGVGQYQHDVSQVALARSLDATVEDCVNGVGVDLNTASVELLSRVAGLGSTLATNIVAFRDEHGAFTERKQISKVPRLGPKAFEQSAGFLRIVNGKNLLDASGVHPEAYPVVKKITDKTGVSIDALMGNKGALSELRASEFADENFGIPTVEDILEELVKPGRDPRPEFKVAKFSDGVESIKDLSLNQVLEGQISNVTNFGAFVDIGVHQDGLVHISAISDTFVKDPHDVLKTGQIVKVKVMSIDVARNRIGLSMRLNDDAHQDSNASAERKSSLIKPSSSRPNNASASTRGGSGAHNERGRGRSSSRQSTQRAQAKPEAPTESAFAESLKAALKAK